MCQLERGVYQENQFLARKGMAAQFTQNDGTEPREGIQGDVWGIFDDGGAPADCIGVY